MDKNQETVVDKLKNIKDNFVNGTRKDKALILGFPGFILATIILLIIAILFFVYDLNGWGGFFIFLTWVGSTATLCYFMFVTSEYTKKDVVKNRKSN